MFFTASEALQELVEGTKARLSSRFTPNNIQYLYLTHSRVGMDYYLQLEGWDDGNVVGGFNDFDLEEILHVLDTRKLGCLEGIFVSEDIYDEDDIDGLLSMCPRLHFYGTMSEDFTSANVVNDDFNPGWESIYSVQPEHYASDVKLKEYFEEQARGSGEGINLPNDDNYTFSEEEETNDPSTIPVPSDDDAQAIRDYYSDYVSGTVRYIISQYEKVFSSGYQVIQPDGMVVENSRGFGVLANLEGEKLHINPVDRNLQYIYRYLKDTMGLVEVPVRNTGEIADVIVTGKDRSGTVYGTGNYIFPYKLMEYAYGCKHVSPDSEDITTYEKHPYYGSWGKFSRDEVYPSLLSVILDIIVKKLSLNGLAQQPESHEANMLVDDLVADFKKSFLTCVLASRFDRTGGSLVTVKFRILDPMRVLPRNYNPLGEVIEHSHGTTSAGGDGLVAKPVSSDEFVEYKVELDSELANSEPLFMYKAYEAMRRQGEPINFTNAILGKNSDDTILRNGSLINYSSKLTHGNAAGSRAGKGVYTLSLLAALIISGVPSPFLDNKPDMASLLLSLCQESFVVNGQQIVQDKEGGTDYFEQFSNANRWINPDHIPDYLVNYAGGKNYTDWGAMIYVRSMLLWLGILVSRIEATDKIDKLGGENGISIVFDELAVLNTGFDNFLSRFDGLMPGSAYAKRLQNGDKVSNLDTPEPAGYWIYYIYESLKSSLKHLSNYRRGAGVNKEFGVSNIFYITQEPLHVYDKLEDAYGCFQNRTKLQIGTGGKSLFHPDILSNLICFAGSDMFVGYEAQTRTFLDQGNPNSPAYEYLNSNARYFGYLSDYNEGTYKQFRTSSLASKATYFKPFLTFADGDQNSYFVQNMLRNLKGLDTDKIIARNSKPDDPTTIHPAVGFKALLNEAGVSDEQIYRTLKKSGDIAQYAVDCMGYQGTWREFIADMRPEFIFNTEDVVKAIRDGITLQSTATQRLSEINIVFPEMFTVTEEAPPLDGGSFQYNEPDDFTGEYTPGVEDQGDWEEDTRRNGRALGGAALGGALVGAAGFTQPVPSHVSQYAGNPYSTRPEFNIPEDVKSTLKLDGSEEFVPDFNSHSQETSQYLEDFRSDHPGMDYGSNHYGRGYSDLPGGRADNYTYPVDPPQVTVPGTFNIYAEASIASLMREVTANAMLMVGGVENLRSVRVLDGNLILNNVSFNPVFERSYINQMPAALRAEIMSGNIAHLVNWQVLKMCRSVQRMSFDSTNFVSDYISSALGWHGRVSVDDFFESFRNLTMLSIGTREFYRRTYRDEVKAGGDFYNPSAMRKMFDVISTAGWSGAKSSMRYTKNTLTRKDIGVGYKLLGATGGLIGAAGAGASVVAAKSGRGLLSAVRSLNSVIRDSFQG